MKNTFNLKVTSTSKVDVNGVSSFRAMSTELNIESPNINFDVETIHDNHLAFHDLEDGEPDEE
jgi:hypothetical protein